MIAKVRWRREVGRQRTAVPTVVDGGYTFLELALALAIIVVLFAAMIPVMDTTLRERRMREVADAISDLAAETRSLAEESGKTQVIVMEKKGIERMDRKSGEAESVLKVPKNAKLEVRFPGGDWSEPDGQIWEFSSAGMVTPISVRLSEGSAWIETDYDFLTGRIAEERFSF